MTTSLEARTRQHREPNGFILPAVLLATIVLTVGASTALMMAMDERTAAGAVLDSGAARFAAEAGIALALEDFPIDSVAGTLAPGEKYEFDWWYHPDVSSFRPTLLRCDDGTGEPMYALTVEGRSSQQVAGGTRNVRLMLSGGPAGGGGGGGGGVEGLPTGAVVVNGMLRMNGTIVLSGACADVHSNGDIKMAATVVTEGTVSASGAISYDQIMLSPDADIVSPESGAPLRDIPTLEPSAFCGEADFFLRNGWVIEAATGDSIDASADDAYGWEYGSWGYRVQTSLLTEGTVCADRSLEVKVVIGEPSNPMELTLLTRGSIQLTQGGYFAAAHSSGAAMIAAGDISLPVGGEIVGLLYAGSQCAIREASITGQLLCKGLPNPGGSIDWANLSQLDGNVTITYACPTSDGLEPLATRASREVW